MEQETSPITLDQVVAYNLRRARQLRGWTQAQAAEHLEPFLGERWSPAVFSAAERSYEGPRVREFTASHLLAFSRGFDLPITWFYEPPSPDAEITSRGSSEVISGEDLVKLLGGRAAETWESVRKLLYDLLVDKAASGDPDYDLVSQAINRALSLDLLTVEDVEAITRLYAVTTARRKATYEAMKGD
ncbi:transcriptional regulator with XRE-family HTH domain [Catenulispora sp. MAP12-49]|uniref:helix-turn-helix domain-containing protein n=1 Tax=Catenulispora sp. MAP12-49 TaxID=3156302 RepID=UPI0035133D47